ncbi:MAG: peptidoglycan DD-metalloendopeptidase family protein [Candidatus Melainabacteria bacterium]|nr:peptidoglycan DD-metalloendopeptidase family protein [Candidatus Melainabacteria bacterium]
MKSRIVKLLLALLALLSFMSFGVQAKTSSSKKNTTKNRTLREIEAKSEYLKRKIEETKEKEKVAIVKLTEIQRRLYNTQEVLKRNKSKLFSTQNDLQLTEGKLVDLKKDYSSLRSDAENRIKQIYQGQRLRILEILLKTPNLTDLLDILYYQKLLVAQDKNLLEKLVTESKEIQSFKDRLAIQKIKMAGIVGEIEEQKEEIAKEHASQANLVSKLRTERASYEQAERQIERESQQLISDINRLVGGESFSGPSLPGKGVFAYPIRGRLTSPFGMRRHPIFKVVSFHSGVDLAAPFGSPIKASDSGRVIFNGWYGGYGKVVIVDHGMNYSTLYAHLSRTSVSRGRNIEQGEIVGYEGQTGYSTGPHLHFEVRKSGRPQNPLNYLR